MSSVILNKIYLWETISFYNFADDIHAQTTIVHTEVKERHEKHHMSSLPLKG